MLPRPSLTILLLLTMLTWAIAGDTWGPDSPGSSPSRPPVVVAGLSRPVLPSPRPSPGAIVYQALDEYGRLLVSPSPQSVLSTVANLLTADFDSSGSTQTGAMVGLGVPASGGMVAVPGNATTGLHVTLRNSDGTAVPTSGSTGLYATIRGFFATDGVDLAPNAYGLRVKGYTAHDAAIATEEPLLTGGYAHATGSLPTAVSANADSARLLVDRYGRARVSLEGAAGVGYAAHNAPITGEPMPIAGKAVTGGSLPAPVDLDNNSAYMLVDIYGRPRVILEDTASAVGHSVKYEASHAGGGTEVTAKASAGVLKWIHVSNPNTTDVWLQIHDASNPTIGSDTPLVAFVIPGGVGASNRAMYNQEFGPVGITFGTGITYTITTTAGGSTAPSSAVSVALGYK